MEHTSRYEGREAALQPQLAGDWHSERRVAMLDDLREPGVKFQSVTEQIDTETPTGRAMWQMIGHARKLISEGETSKSVSAILRVSKATIYRAMP